MFALAASLKESLMCFNTHAVLEADASKQHKSSADDAEQMHLHISKQNVQRGSVHP